MARLFLLLMVAPVLAAAGTTVLFDPSAPETGPFPSDFLTLPDPLQKSGVRIDIPLPDCASQYTACQETGLAEQLDGFSIRARIRVRFSGDVNTATLRDGIFLVALDNVTQDEPGIHKFGDRVAINQLVYDPSTHTVYAKPDGVLDQHRRYGLIVTDAVKDTSGAGMIADAAYTACLNAATPYCASLSRAVSGIAASPRSIVAASVFTTMSATAWLQHARAILDYVPPAPVLAQPQSVFRFEDLSALVLHDQVSTDGTKFADLALPIDSVLVTGLDRLVIGSFRSPVFLEDDQTIRPAPTLPQLEVPAKSGRVSFNVLIPAIPQPARGYPVVIMGHGFGDSRFGGPTAVAPTLARSGFATIAINAVGHGFGPSSTVTFTDKSGHSTTLDAGGRSVDLDGDGIIEPEEGCTVLAPVAVGTRDCFRQTVVDLMQLARVIRQGLDLDGDGRPDLDGSRIYYAGDSLGAIYGAMFMAVEPTVRAAALTVGGASILDIARWSPAYRGQTTETLRVRVPPLLNKGNTYDEDYVLPDQPVKITTVPGAIAIQNVFEMLEWLGIEGDPVAFAPHLKPSPLAGVPARPVLIQFARGDRTMPNPATSTLVRAAGLQASTWIYRHDLARAQAPSLPVDPHPFLVLFVSLGAEGIQLPDTAGLSISLDAQQQIAGFFGADGAAIPDPNGVSRLVLGIRVFEIPSVLPADLGF
jgi:Bacterial Ig-like domain